MDHRRQAPPSVVHSPGKDTEYALASPGSSPTQRPAVSLMSTRTWQVGSGLLAPPGKPHRINCCNTNLKKQEGLNKTEASVSQVTVQKQVTFRWAALLPSWLPLPSAECDFAKAPANSEGRKRSTHPVLLSVSLGRTRPFQLPSCWRGWAHAREGNVLGLMATCLG